MPQNAPIHGGPFELKMNRGQQRKIPSRLEVNGMSHLNRLLQEFFESQAAQLTRSKKFLAVWSA
jgi:hypothetical protein